jgi:hypothetical protein
MPAPRQREQRANDRHQGDHRQRRETHPDHLRRRTEQLDATANIDRHGHPVSMLVAGVRWGGGTSVRDLKIAAGTTMDSDTSLAMYAGHQPSRRAIVAEAADGQSADRSSSLKLVCSSQGRPCGWPPRTVTDADVAVCSRGSWSAHANAMGPGYLYCARRGFASDDVCTLPMVSCSVGPSRRARGIRARGIMVSCCSGGCGSNDLPRQGQNLDPAVVAVGNSGAPRQPATHSRPCGRRGPRYTSAPC